jgi:formylglycine-generating enzyme required for sulfatase activity
VAKDVQREVMALASTVDREQTPQYVHRLIEPLFLKPTGSVSRRPATLKVSMEVRDVVETSDYGDAPQIAARNQRALRASISFRDCGHCPEMAVVPAGSFRMGSPESETDRSVDEGPQHQVTIARPFAVGRYLVRIAEWDACVQAGGCSYGRSDDVLRRERQAFIHASWQDAQAYVAWLSKTTGKSYRLLSEAEREYVTRAGTTTPFWWGPQSPGSSHDAYRGGPHGEYRGRTAAAHTLPANPWGLFDLHGSVQEWVADCWNSNYVGAPSDGSARQTGDCSRRVLRGGSADTAPGYRRSADRDKDMADERYDKFGFRIARAL